MVAPADRRLAQVHLPPDTEMHGLHDSIHRSLLVQSRGALSVEATAYLRTGWVIRRVRRVRGFLTVVAVGQES